MNLEIDPCKLCGDWYCCRGICKNKADYVKRIKRIKHVAHIKKVVVDINKNGIRRERVV